jgi:hypothetical protein
LIPPARPYFPDLKIRKVTLESLENGIGPSAIFEKNRFKT